MTQPKAPKPPQPIADDIPVDRAWKTGRRIYIRCGYQSTLNTALRQIGATWDSEQRALWVGSGKLDQVVPLVQAQAQRIAQVEQVKTSGRWVTIPYEAANIRETAKRLGGIWDGVRKMWAIPTDEALTEVANLVAAWSADREAERRVAALAQQQTRKAAEQEAAADARTTAAEREAQIIAASGRTTLDGRGTASGRLYGRMRRAQAEAGKPQPGEVRRGRDGRRVLVLTSDVEFWSQDAIDDGFSPDPSDDPGWYYRYSYVVVAPNEAEAEQDRVEAAERADLDTIYAVFRAVEAAADRSEVTPETPHIPAGQTITRTSGSVQHFNDGTVTLAGDEAWWYHPGYYDDYRAVQGRVTDPEVLARVRAVFAGGSRQRGSFRVNA